MRFLRWALRRLWQLTDRHHRLSELGAITGRSLLVAGGGGLALLGLTIGACTAIPIGGGTTTTTTTTTAAPTTTTSTSTSTTTTSTTVPPTTTTTVGGGDPCAAQNPTAPGFPCTANAGVHGVTFTAANTTAHNATTCTVCPAGLTWDASNGYRISNCAIIDRWKITGDVDVFATNGNRSIGLSEAATISQACVRITNSLIAPPEPGADNEVALSTGFTGGCCGHTCTFSGAQAPCGPVYLADSEIAMAQPRTSFNYPTSDTNLHLWRDYIHGGPQGIDSDGFSEVHDSYLRADRSEAANTGAAHGDAYFQDGGAGPWMLVDHNTLFCGAAMIDCNVDGAFIGDNSAPNGGVVKNNLFKASTGVNFCMSAGVDESAKPFPIGSNINIKNNVFEIGPSGTPCQHGNAVKTYNKATALANNDHFCNNTMSDGSLVNAAFETGACP